MEGARVVFVIESEFAGAVDGTAGLAEGMERCGLAAPDAEGLGFESFPSGFTTERVLGHVASMTFVDAASS